MKFFGIAILLILIACASPRRAAAGDLELEAVLDIHIAAGSNDVKDQYLKTAKDDIEAYFKRVCGGSMLVRYQQDPRPSDAGKPKNLFLMREAVDLSIFQTTIVANLGLVSKDANGRMQLAGKGSKNAGAVAEGEERGLTVVLSLVGSRRFTLTKPGGFSEEFSQPVNVKGQGTVTEFHVGIHEDQSPSVSAATAVAWTNLLNVRVPRWSVACQESLFPLAKMGVRPDKSPDTSLLDFSVENRLPWPQETKAVIRWTKNIGADLTTAFPKETAGNTQIHYDASAAPPTTVAPGKKVIISSPVTHSMVAKSDPNWDITYANNHAK